MQSKLKNRVPFSKDKYLGPEKDYQNIRYIIYTTREDII